VDWPDLLRFPIIWREAGSGIRHVLERILADRGLSASFLLEVTGAEAVGQAVSAGVGIGFVAKTVLAQRSDWDVKVVHVRDETALRWTLYVAAPDEPYQSSTMRAFLASLQGP